jgi:2-dehydro-3-deoxyphosphogluconate aldolase/(4S)-4-hydroxy-2-oxoglutarate aldolase
VSLNAQQVADDICSSGIVVIIRGQYTLDELEPLTAALIEAGLRTIEVTLNSLDATGAIRVLRKKFSPQARIGAGTVRTAEDAARAFDGGAEFLICPGFSLPVVQFAQARDLLVIPGVMTPSEAQGALDAGCRLQKLFPVETLGGVRYLKAIRAPLDDIGFIPTGGVSEANIAEYRRVGAVAVGVGSSLVSKRLSLSEVARRAAEYHRLWHTASTVHPSD